jgi:hypothetical protein
MDREPDENFNLNDLVLQDGDEVSDQEIIDALGHDDDKPEAEERTPVATPAPVATAALSPHRALPLPERSDAQIQRFLGGADHTDDPVIAEDTGPNSAIESLMLELDDAPTTADPPEAINAPQPSPGNEPAAPADNQVDDLLADLVLAPADNQIDDLTADELDEVVAGLDEPDQQAAVVYVEPAPPSKFDGLQKVTTPEGLAVLRERERQIAAYIERRKRSGAYWRKLFNEATDRIYADVDEAKKIDARRAREADRKQKERAPSANQITAKRIEALDKAIANHGGDHRLVKLRKLGAQAYANFREALTEARRVHGPKASLTKIKAIYKTMFGDEMSKDQCRNRLDVVGELEAKGGPWYRWREC